MIEVAHIAVLENTIVLDSIANRQNGIFDIRLELASRITECGFRFIENDCLIELSWCIETQVDDQVKVAAQVEGESPVQAFGNIAKFP